MGMSFSVYVGPFVRCYGDAKESKTSTVYEDIEEKLSCIVSDGKESCWIPTTNFTTRKVDFSEYDDSANAYKPVYELHQDEEFFQFCRVFGKEIDILKKYYSSVYVKWGIIPRIS